MIDREKVVKGLERCSGETVCGKECPYWYDDGACRTHLEADALALLKAQEPECNPKPDGLPEETKAWLDKMAPNEAFQNIVDICLDWDGYRTADGLGSLINEIWAYAKFGAKKYAPRLVTKEDFDNPDLVDEFGYIPVYEEFKDKEGHKNWWNCIPKGALDERDTGSRCWIGRPSEKQMEETPWE